MRTMDMVKIEWEKPELELISLNKLDVITGSGGEPGEGELD